jgi:hypothetical protein
MTEVMVNIKMLIFFPEWLAKTGDHATPKQSLRLAAFAHLLSQFANVFRARIFRKCEELEACNVHGLLALLHKEE